MLVDSVKDWGGRQHHSVASGLNHINLAFVTHERRISGNSWNTYLDLNPNTDSNLKHVDYICTVVKPGYKALIAECGGKDGEGWKAKAQGLVNEHRDKKFREDLSLKSDASGQGHLMNRLSNHWTEDLNADHRSGVHVAITMVSSLPDPVASQSNKFICNSNSLHNLLKSKLGSEPIFLPQLHQDLCALDPPTTAVSGQDKL